jgi:hypothetical protein
MLSNYLSFFDGAKVQKTFKTPKVFLVFCGCHGNIYHSITISEGVATSATPSSLGMFIGKSYPIIDSDQ